MAQAWYPTETPGPPVPYFEAQGRLPAFVDPYPAWFYGDFDEVDTHASASPPVSAERPTWPVLVFLPGWGSPREEYSGLCADLASRGYVVVALSHPYESAVSVLADGRVVGTAVAASVLGANMADMTPIRAADSHFVLDQLGRLSEVEPASPLVGHLDVQHTGIVGHSMGGAAAAQAVAEEPRFLVGVNLDGVLPAALVGGWHLGAPFLWLQSDGQQQASYLHVRDELMGGLQRGSDVLVVGGSSHRASPIGSPISPPAGAACSVTVPARRLPTTSPGRRVRSSPRSSGNTLAFLANGTSMRPSPVGRPSNGSSTSPQYFRVDRRSMRDLAHGPALMGNGLSTSRFLTASTFRECILIPGQHGPGPPSCCGHGSQNTGRSRRER